MSLRLRLLRALALAACTGPVASGCGSSAGVDRAVAPIDSAAAMRALDGARFSWVSSACVDGALDLAQSGFERELVTERIGNTLRFTYDTTFSLSGCDSTEVFTLSPLPAGQWRYAPQAVVTLPEGAACGAAAKDEQGVLRMTGETLQEVRFASAWCRGYDAMFTYRRVPPRAVDGPALLRRYVAHWNRRDAAAVAALFAEDGMLIEPFSRTEDGAPVRHARRERVQAWLAQAFATTPWLGLSLSAVTALDHASEPASARAVRYVAEWHYMDPRLATPLRGRNLFVVAGNEIYSSEIQLLAQPVALRAPQLSP